MRQKLLRTLSRVANRTKYREIRKVIHAWNEAISDAPVDISLLSGQRLKALAVHACSTTDYYRRTFDDVGLSPESIRSIDDLVKLKPLEKSVLQLQLDRLRSGRFSESELIVAWSGGSTAAATKFYRDQVCQSAREANRWWYFSRMGRSFLDMTGVIWGAAADIGDSSTLRSRLRGLIKDRCVLLPGNQLTAARMRAFLDSLRRYRVRHLHGYSQAVVQLARFVEESGYTGSALSTISVTAEPITPWQQAFVSNTLRCPVYGVYGTRECGYVAAELPNEQGYVVNPLNVIVEIVDRAGMPVPPGSEGDVLVTDLLNYGMPLIRYRIGDTGVLLKSGSSFGGQALQLVAGRNTDILELSGKRVSGAALTLVTVPGLRQIQYVQESSAHVEIRYVCDSDFSGELLAELENRIRQVLGPAVRLVFLRVAAIKALPNGKFPFVVAADKASAQSAGTEN